jgi:hypothetical protein
MCTAIEAGELSVHFPLFLFAPHSSTRSGGSGYSYLHGSHGTKNIVQRLSNSPLTARPRVHDLDVTGRLESFSLLAEMLRESLTDA